MWPGATRAFQASSSGDLYNGVWLLHVAPTVDGIAASPAQSVAYEDRWCPVVRWTRHSKGVRWDFEAVALPEPAPGPFAARGLFARYFGAQAREADRRAVDATLASYSTQRLDSLLMHARRPLERDPADRSNLLVSLQTTVTNISDRPLPVRLALTFQPPADPPPYRDPDSLGRVKWGTAWSSSDSALGFGRGEIRGATLAQGCILAPGSQRSFRSVLPGYPTPLATLRAWAQVPHARRVEETRDHWKREIERGLAFDVPDSNVTEAIRAARVILLSLRERRGNDWVPIGGPFHYRDVWLRDGARAMQALAISGYTDEARDLARAFLRFQWPNGPFVSQGAQLDGIGQASWAFEQVVLRPGPSPETHRFAKSALLAWRYVERQRQRTDLKHRDFFPGMLPYTNPHDNELVHAQLVGNDAWAIAGYRATARLLRAAHMNREADSVLASRSRYTEDFIAALDRMAARDVPPSWQTVGIDWGNLAVGYPCEVLDPSDRRLDVLARRYWVPVGKAGIGYYRNPDSLHSYVGADLGTWALLAGNRSMADSVLEAALHWRSASGGAAEMFTLSGRNFGVNFPPHPTAAAALLALTRNMLVFDDSDTLQLTLGARANWWNGSTLSRAPTRWGMLNLTFVRHGDVAEWRWTPVPVWTALTLPPGTVCSGSLPKGFRLARSNTVVLVPPRTSKAKVGVAPDRSEMAARSASGS